MLKTKRFLYNILKDRYDFGCFAIVGARGVGKTILLKQLSSDYINTVYLDLSEVSADSFDIEEYILKYKEGGIRRFCFDEVCKLDSSLYATFISTIKLFCSELTFFISGSVAVLVEDICNQIGRGYAYDLPPIMYIERLSWEEGYTEINQDIVRLLSSNEKFISYLKHQNTGGKSKFIGYIKGVVSDTLQSYINRSSLGHYSYDLDDVTLNNALKYISLCQFVYKTANNSYVDIEPINKGVKERNLNSLEGYKRKWDLKNQEIESVISLLSGGHLAKRVNIYKGDSINAYYDSKYEDSIVKAYIFEYPWLSSFYVDGIQEEEPYIDMWVESAIDSRAAYIYMYADKLRTLGQGEIDLIYSVGETTDFYGLEIKNRPGKNVPGKYISKEKLLADNVGLKELSISCSDDYSKMLRNDKIVASLEFAYIELCKNEGMYCNINIKDLVRKYFEG